MLSEYLFKGDRGEFEILWFFFFEGVPFCLDSQRRLRERAGKVVNKKKKKQRALVRF